MSGKKLNILFVNPFWDPYKGGIETVIDKVSLGLLDKTNIGKVGLLTTRNLYPSGQVNSSLKFLEINKKRYIYRVRMYPNNLPYWNHLKNSGVFSSEISKVIEDFKPDIVQYMTDNWYIPNIQVFLQSRKSSLQSFTPFYHDIKRNLANFPLILINKYLMKKMNSVQVMTNIEKDKLEQVYGLDKAKASVVSLGVKEMPNKQKNTKNYIQLLSVGRIGKAKGQIELLKVFIKLKSRLSQNLKLVFVGGDGGDLEEMMNIISRNKLEESVEVKGFVSEPELERIYSESDIYVHLTQYESFGLSFVDAASSGLPSVSYSVGALPEILPTGILFAEADKTDQVYSILLRLISNQGLRESIGSEAKKYVKSRYQWRKTVDQYYEIYKKLC